MNIKRNHKRMPGFGYEVSEKLKNNDYPDPLVCYSFVTNRYTEVHVFFTNKYGWDGANYLHEQGYLVLVIDSEKNPEDYLWPVQNCLVIFHFIKIDTERFEYINKLYEVTSRNYCIGQTILVQNKNDLVTKKCNFSYQLKKFVCLLIFHQPYYENLIKNKNYKQHIASTQEFQNG